MKNHAPFALFVCIALLAGPGCGSSTADAGPPSQDGADSGADSGADGETDTRGDSGATGDDASEADGDDDAAEDDAGGGGGVDTEPTEGVAGTYSGMLVGTSGIPFAFRGEALYDPIDPAAVSDVYTQRLFNARFGSANPDDAFELTGFWAMDPFAVLLPLDLEGTRYECVSMLEDGPNAGSCVSEFAGSVAGFITVPDAVEVEWFCGTLDATLVGGVIVARVGTEFALAVGAQSIFGDRVAGARRPFGDAIGEVIPIGDFRFSVWDSEDGFTVESVGPDLEPGGSAVATAAGCARFPQ